MLAIIILPILALIVAILAISLLRGYRKFSEMRSRLPLHSFPTAPAMQPRRPSDDFHDQTWLPLCQSIAVAAGGGLKRPLSAVERRAIWRCRSPLILETALKEILAAPEAGKIAALLAELPSGMDRPDPTGWSRSDNGL